MLGKPMISEIKGISECTFLCKTNPLKTVGGHSVNVKYPSLGSGPLHTEAGERGPPSLILLILLVVVFLFKLFDLLFYLVLVLL